MENGAAGAQERPGFAGIDGFVTRSDARATAVYAGFSGRGPDAEGRAIRLIRQMVYERCARCCTELRPQKQKCRPIPLDEKGNRTLPPNAQR